MRCLRLAARGQTTNDLLVFLFEGHGTGSDMEFESCMKREKENHEEGDSMTLEKLKLLLADSKHKLQLESAEGRVGHSKPPRGEDPSP